MTSYRGLCRSENGHSPLESVRQAAGRMRPGRERSFPMRLKDRIPGDFYKLFASKYRDNYICFLLAIYEETTRLYSALCLTEAECRAVIDECMEAEGLIPSEDEEFEEGDSLVYSPGSTRFLYNLAQWGWLKRDFDERTNSYFYSFPGYSLTYLETFRKLWSEEEDLSHESIRSVYSLLHTYLTDREKDVEILADALNASKRLLQLLSNMQDGMRSYFDELSRQKDIRGIQEVLVDEINNTDSRKYALLTSTDSFYRYKEAVKEIVQEILEDNEARRERMERELTALQPESAQALRRRKNIDRSREADSLVYETLREFDFIEVKYNRLIEQKAVFAARANARIRYLLREGEEEDDNLMAFIGVLRRSPDQEEILAKLRESYALTALSRVVGENSFYARRDEKRAFEPAPPELPAAPDSSDLTDFVVRPEYTQKEIDAFILKNSRGGAFSVTEDTVSGVADLEKLLFVWRDAAAGDGGMRITGTDSDPIRKFGCKYTKFTMEKSENSDD